MRPWHARLVVAGAAWAAAAGPARAADENAPPAPPPATAADAARAAADAPNAAADAAADAETAALIGQLGAADFKDREAAVDRLKQIGRRALPALERAAAHSDPEVASRADSVIRHLERPPVPGRAPGGAVPGRRRGMFGEPAAGVRMRMTVENGVRRIEIREPGRVVRIDDGPGGIRMAVTGQEDGKEITRDFKAATPDELRTQNPEAFELYQRWAGRVGARLVPGGRARRGGVGLRLEIDPAAEERPPLRLPPGDELADLRERLQRQMDDAKLPDDQRREVMGLLERLRAARGGANPLADADDEDGQDAVNREMDAFNRQADALRDRLKDLALPDPGDALPPPAGARLGVTVLEDPDEGVTVVHVMPDGRAAKLGVEPLDVIRKVNGRDVADARSLRRAVTDAAPPLVLEGTRDGEPLKLEEKPEPKPEEQPAPPDVKQE